MLKKLLNRLAAWNSATHKYKTAKHLVGGFLFAALYNIPILDLDLLHVIAAIFCTITGFVIEKLQAYFKLGTDTAAGALKTAAPGFIISYLCFIADAANLYEVFKML